MALHQSVAVSMALQQSVAISITLQQSVAVSMALQQCVAVSKALQNLWLSVTLRRFVPCHIYFPLPAIIPLMLDIIKLGMSGTNLHIMTTQPSVEVCPLN